MWLAKQLFDNRSKFKPKFSNDRGFEWQDECVATKPPPGNGGQPHVMACCGERPQSRFEIILSRSPSKKSDLECLSSKPINDNVVVIHRFSLQVEMHVAMESLDQKTLVNFIFQYPPDVKV